MSKNQRSNPELAAATTVLRRWPDILKMVRDEVKRLQKEVTDGKINESKVLDFWTRGMNEVFPADQDFKDWQIPVRAVITSYYGLGLASRFVLLCQIAARCLMSSQPNRKMGAAGIVLSDHFSASKHSFDSLLQWGRKENTSNWLVVQKYPHLGELLQVIANNRTNGLKRRPTIDEYETSIGCTDSAAIDFTYWLEFGKFKLGHEANLLDKSIEFIIGPQLDDSADSRIENTSNIQRRKLLERAKGDRDSYHDKPILCVTSKASSVGLSAFATTLYNEISGKNSHAEIRFCYLLLPGKQMIGPAQRSSAKSSIRFFNSDVLLSQLQCFFSGKSIYHAPEIDTSVKYEETLQFVRREYSRQRCVVVFDGLEVNNGPLAALENAIAGTGIVGLIHSLATPIEPTLHDSLFDSHFRKNRLVLLADSCPSELIHLSSEQKCPDIGIGAHKKTVLQRQYRNGPALIEATDYHYQAIVPPGDLRYTLADLVWEQSEVDATDFLDVRTKIHEACQKFVLWFSRVHPTYLPIAQLVAISPNGIDVVELENAYAMYLRIYSQHSLNPGSQFIAKKSHYEIEEFSRRFASITVRAKVDDEFFNVPKDYSSNIKTNRLFIFNGRLSQAFISSAFQEIGDTANNERFCLLHRLIAEQVAVRLTEHRRWSQRKGLERRVDLKYCCELMYHGCLSLAHSEKKFWEHISKRLEVVRGVSSLLIPEAPLSALAWFDGVVFREQIDSYPKHELSRFFGSDRIKMEILLLLSNPSAFADTFAMQASKGTLRLNSLTGGNLPPESDQNIAFYDNILGSDESSSRSIYAFFTGKAYAQGKRSWAADASIANLRSIAHAAYEIDAIDLAYKAYLQSTKLCGLSVGSPASGKSEIIRLARIELDRTVYKEAIAKGTSQFIKTLAEEFPEFAPLRLEARFFSNKDNLFDSIKPEFSIEDLNLTDSVLNWFAPKLIDALGSLNAERLDLAVGCLNNLGLVTLNFADYKRSNPDLLDVGKIAAQCYIVSSALFYLAEQIRLTIFYDNPQQYRLYQPSGSAFRGSVRSALQIASLILKSNSSQSTPQFFAIFRLAKDNLNIYVRHLARFPPDQCHALILQSSVHRVEYQQTRDERYLDNAVSTIANAERIILGLEINKRLWKRFLLERMRVWRLLAEKALNLSEARCACEYVNLMMSDHEHLTSLSSDEASGIIDKSLWPSAANRQKEHIDSLKRKIDEKVRAGAWAVNE
jgi:hypothetical protein